MDTSIKTRKRVVITSAVVLFVLYMALPVIASTTAILDGTLDGVGIAYVFGFVVIVAAYVGAVAYCRWAERVAVAAGVEDAAEAEEG